MPHSAQAPRRRRRTQRGAADANRDDISQRRPSPMTRLHARPAQNLNAVQRVLGPSSCIWWSSWPPTASKAPFSLRWVHHLAPEHGVALLRDRQASAAFSISDSGMNCDLLRQNMGSRCRLGSALGHVLVREESRRCTWATSLYGGVVHRWRPAWVQGCGAEAALGRGGTRCSSTASVAHC